MWRGSFSAFPDLEEDAIDATLDVNSLHIHLHVENPDLVPIVAQLNRMETRMTAESDAITAVTAKVDDLVADVRAALAILTAERDSLGLEGQAALADLTAKVDAFDAEVGDADGSDTPPVP